MISLMIYSPFSLQFRLICDKEWILPLVNLFYSLVMIGSCFFYIILSSSGRNFTYSLRIRCCINIICLVVETCNILLIHDWKWFLGECYHHDHHLWYFYTSGGLKNMKFHEKWSLTHPSDSFMIIFSTVHRFTFGLWGRIEYHADIDVLCIEWNEWYDAYHKNGLC